MRTQVTFDCGDPHAQAVFWAQVRDPEGNEFCLH
jgi:predicted enzyme related to lactoylglutathione lyase